MTSYLLYRLAYLILLAAALGAIIWIVATITEDVVDRDWRTLAIRIGVILAFCWAFYYYNRVYERRKAESMDELLKDLKENKLLDQPDLPPTPYIPTDRER